MIAYRLSTLELRGIIERAFLPLRCTCTVAPDYSMTVQISDYHSERVDLCVTGISLNRLNTSRDISDLVAELRYDLAHNSQLPISVQATAG
ncbi:MULTISPECIES: DUF1652 domain-containing protein [unclassified Pseudomonas]|uniref:DUF1652 domain-containing protein n=1 Tax=unclassified Pseudomonas TaxID=196821 RepID=UPI002AC8E5EB|nr:MULTISPECIES: DUF1652 domain-containing protein [unclassified Pseudomonas]MEB0040043.1 DUF1652 domain-containing protein [Pseudomonas sp. MH10]MEB0076441.1 DUF1652 domain-containing protein [Pseudomonas sp. MH10out]MEB0091210.1 DUF1652 domain-containing protein [Pseudomonas sp. CCI4.2]MEB0100836.1 DUF1652 domain-containing protein [Pseudomonas sp. CCI3.2]MEB0119568.1 DUF1652 domain-containing protein [Pseudomonas sp. CCI1.2]